MEMKNFARTEDLLERLEDAFFERDYEAFLEALVLISWFM